MCTAASSYCYLLHMILCAASHVKYVQSILRSISRMLQWESHSSVVAAVATLCMRVPDTITARVFSGIYLVRHSRGEQSAVCGVCYNTAVQQ